MGGAEATEQAAKKQKQKKISMTDSDTFPMMSDSKNAVYTSIYIPSSLK